MHKWIIYIECMNEKWPNEWMNKIWFNVWMKNGWWIRMNKWIIYRWMHEYKTDDEYKQIND